MSKTFRIIDGLKTNTTYKFYVRAKNIFGAWSDLPAAVSIVTSRDTTPPPAPSSLTLTIRPGMFVFNWPQVTAVDMRGGGYRLYVFTSNTPTSSKRIKAIGFPGEWAVVMVGDVTDDATITITNRTTYWWWITSVDASGNESARTASTPASGSISEWDWRRTFLMMGV